MAGGDSGDVIEPGNPAKSLFMTTVRYSDPDLQMPPKYKLKDEEISILNRWIAMGAPDPRIGNRPKGEKTVSDRLRKRPPTLVISPHHKPSSAKGKKRQVGQRSLGSLYFIGHRKGGDHASSGCRSVHSDSASDSRLNRTAAIGRRDQCFCKRPGLRRCGLRQGRGSSS